MKQFFLLLIITSLLSCQSKQRVDMLVHNATIYTVDESFSTVEAFVILDGKIIDTGTLEKLNNKYTAAEKLDAEGNYIYPAFIDAHCHFYGLGQQQQRVNLVGTNSWEQVLAKVDLFQEENKKDFIIGRGWDQNDWDLKDFPTNEELNKRYPDIPVALTRVDGHAMIVNDAALRAANITTETPANGGDIFKENDNLTGVLIDNPMQLIEATFPKESASTITTALLDAQKINHSYGIATVDDAGLDREVIEIIDSLQQAGTLKTRIYAMVSNTPENLDYFLDHGIIKTDRLNVRSVKFYADGALGSRGAAMKEPYSDKPHHHGALLSTVASFKATAQRIAATDYQMNTHAIGDSANYVVLKTYKELLTNESDRRWRVEHAQIVDTADFAFFDSHNIIPSVQPTHATSDMYWAQDRVGEQRMSGAYAYKTLLSYSKKLPLGTDYPVEQVNPFLTFYAAVARQDTSGFPENGFIKEEALSRVEALRGMTIWAAFSNFEEEEKGSIEAGKFADFIILEKDLMTMSIDEVPDLSVQKTFINGELVYNSK